MKLQRKDFIDVIQESFKDVTNDFLNKRVCAVLIDVFAKAVTKVLVSGNDVNIRGFGTFVVRERKAQEYYNPNDRREKITKPATIYPAFIAGKELTRAVKEQLGNEGEEDI
jgi:DNA-binding protein HU-beta